MRFFLTPRSRWMPLPALAVLLQPGALSCSALQLNPLLLHPETRSVHYQRRRSLSTEPLEVTRTYTTEIRRGSNDQILYGHEIIEIPNLGLTVVANGTLGHLDFRAYYVDLSLSSTSSRKGVIEVSKDSLRSPWHDIPLHAGKTTGGRKEYHMVVEIPKFTQRKMEIHTRLPFNPLIQDVKDGIPREYPGKIYWNYGALTQTWENPDHRGGEEVHFTCGDGDPVDVVEVGKTPLPFASVRTVKIIGGLSLVDSGELDWKLLAIDSQDPYYHDIDDIGDVEAKYPHTINGVREWFRWYKLPDGKPHNLFGHGGNAVSAKEAEDVVEKMHEAWKELTQRREGEGEGRTRAEAGPWVRSTPS